MLIRNVMLALMVFAGACSTQGNVFSLGVGQCFAGVVTVEEEVSEVSTVDCVEPHINEIYALPLLPDGDFPSVFVDDDSGDLCLAAFESYVGIAYEYSIYDIGWLRPSQETWDKWDDREVVCYLYDFNGETKTGTARSSGR